VEKSFILLLLNVVLSISEGTNSNQTNPIFINCLGNKKQKIDFLADKFLKSSFRGVPLKEQSVPEGE
jgi:hypothetical protein